jgi:hypothetical protein
MLSIWTGKDDKEWMNFKQALNVFGKLKWITIKLTTEVIFLHLIISISINSNRRIKTTTYTTPIKLHLYIPGLLAHPDGCLIGMILGNDICYWQQNSDITAFTIQMAKFTTHLRTEATR